MAVRLSALRTSRTLLPRNIIILMFLVLISVRGWVVRPEGLGKFKNSSLCHEEVRGDSIAPVGTMSELSLLSLAVGSDRILGPTVLMSLTFLTTWMAHCLFPHAFSVLDVPNSFNATYMHMWLLWLLNFKSSTNIPPIDMCVHPPCRIQDSLPPHDCVYR
jgi:hypothetical protein